MEKRKQKLQIKKHFSRTLSLGAHCVHRWCCYCYFCICSLFKQDFISYMWNSIWKFILFYNDSQLFFGSAIKGRHTYVYVFLCHFIRLVFFLRILLQFFHCRLWHIWSFSVHKMGCTRCYCWHRSLYSTRT